MKKKVIIIGGGFAGVNLAQNLSKAENLTITLVDKNNYNFFAPLLYQVATGFLDISNISYPFRKLFRDKKNIRNRLGELIKIMPEENRILLTSGYLEYDYLVLATGSVSNYFGMENIEKNSQPMKTLSDAIEMRNFLFLKAEEASISQSKKEREKLTTIVIAGGGPTGVEVAGMLSEMRKNILYKDYPELSDANFRIILVDGAPVLLTPMSPASQQYTFETLTKMGVEIRLNMQVKDYQNDKVIFANGDSIETKVLFWTAGVTCDIIDGLPPESYGRGRRLLVDNYNKLEAFDNIYAIGDNCIMSGDPQFASGHPQLAQPALQQGKNLAHNLKAMETGKELKGFRYKDKGSMAIIGRSKAVADLPKPKLNFNGWLAWMMWLFVHLFSLINYRNRIKTMYNWTVAYFTKDQSMRLIIRPNEDQRIDFDKNV